MTQVPNARAATIEDVARAAGVSRAAVSKVIRNAYGVSPAMRERVTAAITDLAYRPSVAARAMRGSSYTLGIEIPDFRNQFFTKVLEGATQELADTNYQLIIAPAAAGTRAGYRAVEALVDQQVDGLIAVAPLIEKSWLEDIARRTPVVMFGRHDWSDLYDGVAGNDRAGARAVMDHLFELGHNDIMHLTIDASAMAQDHLSPQDIRLDAYLATMAETGRGDRAEVVRTADGQISAHRALLERLDSGPLPTAIFAGHDELAIGALRAVSELGLDISVIGYDDVPIAAHPAMSLSSVDQNGEKMGARAAQMLLERLQGRTESVHEMFEPILRVRNSTRPVT